MYLQYKLYNLKININKWTYLYSFKFLNATKTYM